MSTFYVLQPAPKTESLLSAVGATAHRDHPEASEGYFPAEIEGDGTWVWLRERDGQIHSAERWGGNSILWLSDACQKLGVRLVSEHDPDFPDP